MAARRLQLTVAAAALLGAKLHSLAERGAPISLVERHRRRRLPLPRRHRRRSSLPRSRALWFPDVPLPAPGRHGGVLHPRRHDPDSLRLFPLRMLLRHRVPAVGAQLPARQPGRNTTWASSGSPTARGASRAPTPLLLSRARSHDRWRCSPRLAGVGLQGRSCPLAVHESGKGLLEFVRAADPHQQGHLIQTGPLALAALATAGCSSCAGGGRTRRRRATQ